eukprot:199776-Prymnesium_polylepis.1
MLPAPAEGDVCGTPWLGRGAGRRGGRESGGMRGPLDDECIMALHGREPSARGRVRALTELRKELTISSHHRTFTPSPPEGNVPNQPLAALIDTAGAHHPHAAVIDTLTSRSSLARGRTPP